MTPTAATVAAYEGDAEAYAEASPTLSPRHEALVAGFARRVGPGARVLEIGTGGGRDALALESHGVRVHRTDVTPGFVRALRAAGFAAGVLDPLTDDLAPASAGADHDRWDGVWAQACLLHVDRDDLPVVLRRLAAVTRPGGALFASLKEGDGEEWSTHGAVSAPRRFVYWRQPALTDVLTGAGWRTDSCDRVPGSRGETWLMTTAEREEEP